MRNKDSECCTSADGSEIIGKLNKRGAEVNVYLGKVVVEQALRYTKKEVMLIG
ncbi:hypothetical protein GO684_04630 [Wolbachia endosymbiont of Litomosoides brasiliensis]|uniref:hypothetical protein n=1 Tax=Wolbachia endosymbiont of Litomosoides brasiliensis TaxID=1812117 RepID=UPI00158A3FB2|nr:hypothetical protein [Wolbachia endosymbiont of Litomosoides brasiliensis]NUY39884.1 hypothetical protein [Wolbachia endosymbiont of Litomosoides brasiliensis]